MIESEKVKKKILSLLQQRRIKIGDGIRQIITTESLTCCCILHSRQILQKIKQIAMMTNMYSTLAFKQNLTYNEPKLLVFNTKTKRIE